MTTPGPWDGLERRQATRHHLAVPVSFDQGTGVSRNVSVSGIAFETDRPLVPGRPARFSLALPHVLDDAVVWLHCEGRIVRAEPAPSGLHVAARITSHRLATASPGP